MLSINLILPRDCASTVSFDPRRQVGATLGLLQRFGENQPFVLFRFGSFADVSE